MYKHLLPGPVWSRSTCQVRILLLLLLLVWSCCKPTWHDPAALAGSGVCPMSSSQLVLQAVKRLFMDLNRSDKAARRHLELLDMKSCHVQREG